MNNEIRNIISVIPHGEENAISMKRLADLLDTTERHARQIIQTLRENGVPVLSVPGDKGYYFSSNLYDINTAITCFECRKNTNQRITKTLSQFARYVENGGTIEKYLEELKEGKA